MTIQTPFNLEDLADFLIKAKPRVYSSEAEIHKPQELGCEEFLLYVERDFEYNCAVDKEGVKFKGVPVWSVVYSGGMLPKFSGDLEFTKKTFEFLRRAISKFEHDKPFRGPHSCVWLPFVYADESEGDITDFRGRRRIFWSSYGVFSQDYIGGLIIHK